MAFPIALLNANNARRNTKKLKELIDKRPEYKINQEAYDNQAIAKAEAYGRDRGIQRQETQLEQDAANAVGDVKDVASSTNALLGAITAIKANQNATRRGLAQDEAQLMAQKKAQLLNVNQQMIDEKDKAWNYNQNMPYQMKVAALRDRVKYNQEQAAQQFAASSNFMTNMFAGGGFNWGGGQKQDQSGVAGGGPMYNSGGGGGGGMMKGMGQTGMGGFGF